MGDPLTSFASLGGELTQRGRRFTIGRLHELNAAVAGAVLCRWGVEAKGAISKLWARRSRR